MGAKRPKSLVTNILLRPERFTEQSFAMENKFLPRTVLKSFSSVPPDWEKYKKLDYLFGSVKNVSSWLPTKDETLMKT